LLVAILFSLCFGWWGRLGARKARRGTGCNGGKEPGRRKPTLIGLALYEFGGAESQGKPDQFAHIGLPVVFSTNAGWEKRFQT
jgi:hypothetical protein